MGVELTTPPHGFGAGNAAGVPVQAPDQGFFNDLNGELTDKGFLVTST